MKRQGQLFKSTIYPASKACKAVARPEVDPVKASKELPEALPDHVFGRFME